MNKNEVAELKKRLTKNQCTFTKMCGCYVDSDKNRIVDINETFLNLDEDEFHKYLDIAKKTLSGTLGNNLLNLDYELSEEEPGGKQQFLMALRESKLKNTDLLERFYELIIDTYDQLGNYLILIFHDAYDVIKKTTDNDELDESEEVYEYLLCAVCPVILSKPALGYREDEHRIGSRIRDWIVGAPESGFLFPAFNDRSTDIHSLLFYTKDTKEPHIEFMEDILGCDAKPTATIERQNFDNIIQSGLCAQTSDNELMYMDIQLGLNDMITEQVEVFETDSDNYIFDDVQLDTLMKDCNVPEESADKIKDAYKEVFEKDAPVAAHLIDQRSLKNTAAKKEKMELVKQVAALNKQIDENFSEDMEMIPAVKNKNIILKVRPEKASEITLEEINGHKCVVIPLEEDEELILNEE